MFYGYSLNVFRGFHSFFYLSDILIIECLSPECVDLCIDVSLQSWHIKHVLNKYVYLIQILFYASGELLNKRVYFLNRVPYDLGSGKGLRKRATIYLTCISRALSYNLSPWIIKHKMRSNNENSVLYKWWDHSPKNEFSTIALRYLSWATIRSSIVSCRFDCKNT